MGAREARGANYAGLRDPIVDTLIARGQREVDFEARMAIWRELHARIYELQPYLFFYNVPRKFAMNRNLRGLQLTRLRPGYIARRFYYPAGTPGTRPRRER